MDSEECNRSDPSIDLKDEAKCRKLDSAVTEVMLKTVTARTDEALNAQFGISYNTWRKIVASKPIRRTVAQRLEQRIRLGKRI